MIQIEHPNPHKKIDFFEIAQGVYCLEVCHDDTRYEEETTHFGIIQKFAEGITFGIVPSDNEKDYDESKITKIHVPLNGIYNVSYSRDKETERIILTNYSLLERNNHSYGIEYQEGRFILHFRFKLPKISLITPKETLGKQLISLPGVVEVFTSKNEYALYVEYGRLFMPQRVVKEVIKCLIDNGYLRKDAQEELVLEVNR